MGMRPTIALIPFEGNILKASVIHMAALLYILPRIFGGYKSCTEQ